MEIKLLSDEEAKVAKAKLEEQYALEEDESKYSSKEINWIDSLNNFEEAKEKTIRALSKSQRLFILGSTKDKIVGRPQLNGTTLNTIVVLKKVQKVLTNRKDGLDDIATSFKFMDDSFDKRYDGQEVATLSFDFYTYIVTGKDNRVYTLLTKEKLPNEICTFRGMIMPMNDAVEVSKTLKINKLTDIFFVYSFESAVKTLSKEQLVELTKSQNISLQNWRDILGIHPLNSINRYPEETENLRSIIMLSGKKDNYPMPVLLVGRAGTKKSAFLETLDFKINSEPRIAEGSITTLKGLTPSFVSKPANIGFLCSANRLALVDELGKMVEKEMNRHEQQSGNLLGDFNSLLEHKKRVVSSGNDNSTEIQMTAKTIATTNPVSKKTNIHQHIGTIDATYLSRNLIWVQNQEETEFLLSKDSIISPKGGLSIYSDVNKSDSFSYTLWGELGKKEITRDTILTIFDSAYIFTCDIDLEEVEKIVNETIKMASEPMKSSVWKPRALHHVFLVIDGLCKQRCLFEDYDNTFKANKKDYDLARKLLYRMVLSWDTNFSEGMR